MITVNLIYCVDLIIYTLNPLTLHFIDPFISILYGSIIFHSLLALAIVKVFEIFIKIIDIRINLFFFILISLSYDPIAVLIIMIFIQCIQNLTCIITFLIFYFHYLRFIQIYHPYSSLFSIRFQLRFIFNYYFLFL